MGALQIKKKETGDLGERKRSEREGNTGRTKAFPKRIHYRETINVQLPVCVSPTSHKTGNKNKMVVKVKFPHLLPSIEGFDLPSSTDGGADLSAVTVAPGPVMCVSALMQKLQSLSPTNAT